MKKGLCLFLVLCMFLSGCSVSADRRKETASFYYLRTEYQYGHQDGVIVIEERDLSGHRDSLSYLLALYLVGPMKDGLVCPLPKGTRIYSAEQGPNGISLKLSDTLGSLTDADFSLACACLTLTCLNLTDSDSVTITSGSRSVTMTRDSLTLCDGNTAETEETQ